MLETDLVLIGPTGSGKSTLAKMLGEALEVPFLDLSSTRSCLRKSSTALTT